MRVMAGVLATMAVLAGSGCAACDPYYNPDACRSYNYSSSPGYYNSSPYSDSGYRRRDEGRRDESRRDEGRRDESRRDESRRDSRPSPPPERPSSDSRNTLSGAVSDAASRSGRGQ